MLRQSKRISGKIRISQIIEEGFRIHSELFAIRHLPATQPFRRYAVAIGRKITRSAVERNHLRRRIYESVRAFEKENPSESSFDIVIMARTSTLKAGFGELQSGMKEILNKI